MCARVAGKLCRVHRRRIRLIHRHSTKLYRRRSVACQINRANLHLSSHIRVFIQREGVALALRPVLTTVRAVFPRLALTQRSDQQAHVHLTIAGHAVIVLCARVAGKLCRIHRRRIYNIDDKRLSCDR